MLCKNCGSQIPDNSKFCVNCGTKIESGESSQQSSPQPKKVISDKHYSLEEIAEQQKKLEHLSFGVSDVTNQGISPKVNLDKSKSSSGVNLSKGQTENDLSSLIHSETSPFSQSLGKIEEEFEDDNHSSDNFEAPLPPIGESYKLKSAGFDDELKPVKRPPISEPVVKQNNSTNEVQLQSNNQVQTNNIPQKNYSVGEASVQNVTPAQTNNVPQKNYGVGGVSVQNDTPTQTNNVPQKNYSVGGASVQNGTPAQTNNVPQKNYSVGGASVQNGTPAQTNNVPQKNYSVGGVSAQNGTPTSSQSSVSYNVSALQYNKKNSKSAKIFLGIAVGIGILMVGAIVYMLVSGYYKTDFKSQSEYKDTSNSVSVDANVEKPASSVDFSNLVYSNIMNGSIATEDDKGNVYYADYYYNICKVDSSGNKTSLYKLPAYSMYMNYYNDRLYFITKKGIKYSVCSIKTDGSDFKTVTADDQNISSLSVFNGYIYYCINQYGSNHSGVVFRKNIETGKTESVCVFSDSRVSSIYEYKDSIYVFSRNNSSYEGKITKIDSKNLSKSSEINSPTVEKYDYYNVVISEDKFYFVNFDENENSYSLWSMNLDGTDGKKIYGTDCEQLAVYGDYIYYTTSLNSGESSKNNNALYRIKTDGTGNVCIISKGVSYMSFAGGKMYYIDDSSSDSEYIVKMNLDGTERQIIT